MSTIRDRQRMIDDIESEVAFTRTMIGRDHLDPRSWRSCRKYRGRNSCLPAKTRFAFDNGPLSIGYGQTISQPYIVALMTDLLQIKPDHSILEIGTGSGYQTAILSLLCKQVYTCRADT